MYQWKDEYVLGIDEIDLQHRKLIDIANQVYAVLNDQWRTDKFNQIIDVLEELKDYTVYHFKAEEEYMTKTNYKKRFSHAIEHSDFVAKLNSVDLSEVDAKQEVYLKELLGMITDWVVNHILTSDKLYAQK